MTPAPTVSFPSGETALNVAPPPSGQERLDRLGSRIAWLVVIAVLALVVAANLYASHIRRHHSPAVVQDPAKVQSIELLMTGRTAVGYRTVLSVLEAAQGKKIGAASANAEANARQVRELAISPLEKLRAAPILGELGGSAPALAELDEIPVSADGPASLAADVRSLRIIYTRGSDALNDADRRALTNRHGWFGQLAVSFDKPDSEPQRSAVMAPAKRAAWFTMIMGGMVLMAFVAGLVLAILALIRFVQGRFRSAYASPGAVPPELPRHAVPLSGFPGHNLPLVYFSPPPPPAPVESVGVPVAEAPPRGGPFVEAFAIYLAGQILIGEIIHLVLKNPGIAWEWVLLLFIPLPIFWPLLRGISRSEWKRAVGWHTGRGAWREIGCGFVGYLAGLPVVAIGGLIAMLLGKLTHAKPTHPIVFEFSRGLLPALQAFALACIWAPIVEETLFRGALFHHLRRFGRGWRWLPSALLVSFIFAAVHPQGWTYIPVLGSLAVVFAALREWRGSILTSATAHFIQNCFIVIMMAGVLG